jgi:hypothetical protein
VEVELNGRALAAWTLGRETPVDVAAVVAGGLPRQNVLTFRLPDVPEVPPGRGDQRALRAAVYWLRFDPFPGLTLGEPVRFDRRAADPYLGEGWGEGEREYRWTIAPRAELFLSAGSLPPALLRLQAHPYPVSARGSGQRVFVSVDGELVSTLALREAEPAVRSVPLLFGLPAAARVTLELPDAVAPRGDLRQLGMAVHWLRFDPWPRVPVGGVDLGGTSGDPFLGDGWAVSENGRRWTVGVSAEVYFAADPAPPARLVLTLDAFLHRRLPAQRLRFELNGERLDEVTVAEPGRRPVELPVPAGLLRPQNVLRLALPDARSPASLGASRDARVLGVRVGTLQLAPAAGHGVAPGASKP